MEQKVLGDRENIRSLIVFLVLIFDTTKLDRRLTVRYQDGRCLFQLALY